MSARIDLACMVCAEEFVISAETYGDHSQAGQCPCCGSTDLVPLVFDEGVNALPAGLRGMTVAGGGKTFLCRETGRKKGDGPRRLMSVTATHMGPTAPGRRRYVARASGTSARWGRTVLQPGPGGRGGRLMPFLGSRLILPGDC